MEPTSRFMPEPLVPPDGPHTRYYNLLRAWHVRDDNDFKFVNSHEKAGVTDSASKERLRNVLRDWLNNSKNMILILGTTTRFDTDWVPFEIEHAIDKCGLPIIAVYPDCQVHHGSVGTVGLLAARTRGPDTVRNSASDSHSLQA